MKSTFGKLLVAAVVIGVIAHVAVSVAHHMVNRAKLDPVVTEGFEVTGFEDLDDRITQQFCCDHSERIEDVTTIGGHGMALSVELRPDDPDVKGSKRAEIRLPASHFDTPVWYRARLYIAPDWPTAEDPVTLLQWHAVPDKILREGNRAPPLRLLEFQDETLFIINWDSAPRTFKRFDLFGEKGGEILWQAPTAKGEWQDWVFRVEWGRGTPGRVTAWKNGERLADYRGRTGYNDMLAPYLKAGIYVPRWKGKDVASEAKPLQLFLDDIWEIYPQEAGDALPADVAAMIGALEADLPD